MAIKLLCHSHHELYEVKESTTFQCTLCHQQIEPMQTFGKCAECRFYMCTSCASLKVNDIGQTGKRDRQSGDTPMKGSAARVDDPSPFRPCPLCHSEAGILRPPGLGMPAPPAPILGTPADLAQLQANLIASQKHQTTTLQNSMGEIKQQLQKVQEKVDEHDNVLASHSSTLDDHGAKIELLTQRYEKLTASINRSRSAPPSGRGDENRNREAFIGGLPDLQEKELIQHASDLIGTPTGFEKVRAPEGAGNHVFILFDTVDNMKTFVNTFQAPSGIRVKPNRSTEARANGRLIYETCEALRAAGIPQDKLLAKRGCFWTRGDKGAVTLLGKIENGKVKWTEHAPAECRNDE